MPERHAIYCDLRYNDRPCSCGAMRPKAPFTVSEREIEALKLIATVCDMSGGWTSKRILIKEHGLSNTLLKRLRTKNLVIKNEFGGTSFILTTLAKEQLVPHGYLVAA